MVLTIMTASGVEAWRPSWAELSHCGVASAQIPPRLAKLCPPIDLACAFLLNQQQGQNKLIVRPHNALY